MKLATVMLCAAMGAFMPGVCMKKKRSEREKNDGGKCPKCGSRRIQRRKGRAACRCLDCGKRFKGAE